MKTIIYLTSFLLILSGLWMGEAKAQGQVQSVFNDTIYFSIIKTRPTTDGAKYLLDFQTATGSSSSFTGKMLLSVCSCYCDSIWDAWPKTPSDSIMTGGSATVSYYSGSGSNGPGILGNGGLNRFRGRLNIWQMPGSFLRKEAFTLPVVFTID